MVLPIREGEPLHPTEMDLSVREGEILHPVVHALELATGRRPHKSCAYRWMLTGSQHVRLPYVMYGGQRMTSVEAVHRWISAVTAAHRDGVPAPRTGQVRDQEAARAEQNLDESGW